MNKQELKQFRTDSDKAEKNRKRNQFVRLQKKNGPIHDKAKSTLINIAAAVGIVAVLSVNGISV